MSNFTFDGIFLKKAPPGYRRVHACPSRTANVYLLELAGDDDAFATREASAACSSVKLVAPGLATAHGLSARFRGLAYVHTASRSIGTCEPTVDAARKMLDRASFRRSSQDVEQSTIAVRARDVRSLTGISTREAERILGGVLTDRGFTVDLDNPDAELRALFSEGICGLGWLEVETVRDFGDRRPTDKPFFQPGSMDPLLARAIVNIAGACPETLVVDPMCGTGGVLVEAGLVGADVVGVDAQRKMARGARENLSYYLRESLPDVKVAVPGRYDVACGDATKLPIRDDTAGAVVFDAPYGRQSKIANRSLEALVTGALSEARRIAPRAVVIGDRSWAGEATDAGWNVESTFQRRVHRSLDRHILVLDSGG